MPEQLTDVNGDKFVAKLLAGERDFRRVKLQRGYNISAHERVEEFWANLGTDDNQKDLKENPINLIGADLSGIN